jgi:hypothetical protein
MLAATAGFIILFKAYAAARHVKYIQKVTLEGVQKLDQRHPPEWARGDPFSL